MNGAQALYFLLCFKTIAPLMAVIVFLIYILFSPEFWFYLLTSCLVFLVRLYQLTISPLLGDCCRFHPTCSAYMIEALKTHGPFKGGWLGFKRICKCHPWHPGGHDPIP